MKEEHTPVKLSESHVTGTVHPIPLVDLLWQHRHVSGEVIRRWEAVAETADFILGEDVLEFERAYSAFAGVRHCAGVASGTDALELALRAGGVGAGDEVIVPTNSFIASAAAVVRAGATPVFVDVDPIYLLIDPTKVAGAVTAKTAAVVAVHLFGQMAPMTELRSAVGERMLLIEDAAQAHGASQDGIGPGGFGLAAATSFYPGKNLGAYGDAGAVLTDDDGIAERTLRLRDHGSSTKYEHPELGFNCRLDTLQAVVLREKLRFLAAWNGQRRRAADVYDDLLQDVPDIQTPKVVPGNEHVWHLYVVRVPNRDRVLGRLRDVGIGAGVHYPIPIHMQGAFRFLGHEKGDFPVAERSCEEILSLPIYPGIDVDQQLRVVEELRRALG